MTVRNVCSLNAVRRALKEGSKRKDAVRHGYGIAREMIEDGMMKNRSPVAERVLEGHAKRFAAMRGKTPDTVIFDEIRGKPDFMNHLDQAMEILDRAIEKAEKP